MSRAPFWDALDAHLALLGWLKTNEGAQYCAEINQAAHRVQRELALDATAGDLPVVAWEQDKWALDTLTEAANCPTYFVERNTARRIADAADQIPFRPALSDVAHGRPGLIWFEEPQPWGFVRHSAEGSPEMDFLQRQLSKSLQLVPVRGLLWWRGVGTVSLTGIDKIAADTGLTGRFGESVRQFLGRMVPVMSKEFVAAAQLDPGNLTEVTSGSWEGYTGQAAFETLLGLISDGVITEVDHPTYNICALVDGDQVGFDNQPLVPAFIWQVPLNTDATSEMCAQDGQVLAMSLHLGAAVPGQWSEPGFVWEAVRWLMAFWAWIAVKTKPIVATGDRALRRRAQRAATAPNRCGHEWGEVRVVTLRRHGPAARQAQRKRRSSDDPYYDHQFQVSGHWRNQPYGPGRSQRRRIWIDDYRKGPEEAPFIAKDTIYRVER